MLVQPEELNLFESSWGGEIPAGPRLWSVSSPQVLMWGSQVVLMVKNPPANAGDIRDVGSIPGSGNPLEEGMATHSSILAWGIP